MKSSSLYTIAAGLLFLGSGVFAQEPRPPAGPAPVEPRPPLPRDDYRRPEPPPLAAPRVFEHRPFDRQRPHDLRGEPEHRPGFKRGHHPQGKLRSPGPDRDMQDRGPRAFAPQDGMRPGIRSRGEYLPNRPRPDFRPEPWQGRHHFEPRQTRPSFESREGSRYIRPPGPSERNDRNLSHRPGLREFAPMARGPRPEMVRPRERDARWEHRAPRFPRDDAGGAVGRASGHGRDHHEGRRGVERPANPPQPLPFQ
jgi:hypothetical protein